jgi:hypothetical protein
MFGDPRFAALGVHAARLVVPWDVASGDMGKVDAWLEAAATADVKPFVVFDHSREDQCPSAPCRLPSATAYEDAVRAFLAKHPEVRTITPWNEPNHAAEPTAGRPDRAAAYYNAARRACPACTLVAGDVIDGGDWTKWIQQYRSALGEKPTTWGLHNYYDTTYFRTSGLETMLGLVDGDVWLTETGGIVELRTREGQVSLPSDERRASASVSLALDAARTYASRVRRVYLYQWQTGPDARFDAGLLRPDGSARPAYEAVRTQAGAFARPSAGGSASAGLDAGASVPGRVTLRASGRGTVRVRCPSAPDPPCQGRLWIEGAAYANGTLINGHTPGSVLRPVTTSLAQSGRRSLTLRFAVGRSVMARARTTRALALRLMLSTPTDPLALRGRYVVRLWRPPSAPSRRRG